ncbi:glycosyltransferase family 4 protein [Allorhizobium undicola]|uniref:glycosyltransferase family 4 protein n=1 Tax=Allorhizobium undicola TaxID=78527 RepID=UPI000B32A4EF|nr:glycosyltransferase family 4 protein [Allorhizobium undicola]
MKAFPSRILMTVDAVGGVWRYSLDLAAELGRRGVETIFVGLGPSPEPHQIAEAAKTGELLWLGLPLDWMAGCVRDLESVAPMLAETAERYQVDLLHLNLPSQASGLHSQKPVVTVSHSCIPTWSMQVKGTRPPQNWHWHGVLNRQGLMQATAVVAPSHSHGQALETCYGPLPHLSVIENASAVQASCRQRDAVVFAAGRWWDEGKNGRVLDAAAGLCGLPVLMAGELQGPEGQSLVLSHARGLGPMPHRAMVAALAQAEIFASPSLYEPFGLAALEAARCGVPMVLADIATYRELWQDAALFAPPDDPDAFAAVIREFHQRPQQRQALAARAMFRAAEFTLARQADAMLALYRGCSGAKAASPLCLSARRLS